MSASNNGNPGLVNAANMMKTASGVQSTNQYSGMPSGNNNFGSGFTGDSGYPGMAQGPYSNIGNMMMGRNPYQQYFGGGYQGMYNNGSQPAQQVNQDWYKTASAQNPTATPGQTAFPGVNMNTGSLMNAPQTASTQPMQYPTTNQTATSRFANDPYAGIDPITGAMVFK